MSNFRSSRWSLIMYGDRDVTYMNILSHLDFVNHFAISPYHDKDINEDGSLKKVHFHVLVTLNYSTTVNNLRDKVFKDYKENILGQKIKDKYSAFEYLTHENDNDKVSYDTNDIYCDSLDFWTCDNENYQELEIINGINSGISIKDMILLYGRKFIYHYNQYKEMADRFITEKKVKNK